MPGWYPDADGDSVHPGLNLREEAGLLIGGGPRAFQKYGSGVMAPSDAAMGLLEIIAIDPGKVEVPKGLRQGSGAPGPDDASVRKQGRPRQTRRRDHVAA